MSHELAFRALPPRGVVGRYALGPDSVPQPGRAQGSLVPLTIGTSPTYPGLTHRVTVYVPPGGASGEPCALALFLDGDSFAEREGDLPTPVVLDNLIATDRLAPTLAVFVEPGRRANGEDSVRPRQRNLEYDPPDDRFVTFLVDEVLPSVARRWSVSPDPSHRVICGFSSGGNGAFTAAWHRPDIFGCVIGFSASFAQMPGGNPYPRLIAETPRRPLRVLLQVGQRDLGWDEPVDNWLTHTLRVSVALLEAGYDTRLVVGHGEHDPNHAGVLLPDALLWALGRDDG